MKTTHSDFNKADDGIPENILGCTSSLALTDIPRFDVDNFSLIKTIYYD